MKDLHLVLASGGLDSSTLISLAQNEGTELLALFVDYGQPARMAEESAITKLSKAMQFPLRKIRYQGREFKSGEIRGRNAFLLQLALMEFPAESGAVLLGVHSGNGYLDCSPEFMDLMKRSFEFHSGGTISVEAPFLQWTKSEVFKVGVEMGVPISVTYSCEAANSPCGNCDSCRARSQMN